MTRGADMRGWIERFLSPGLGCCYRCNRPWKSSARRVRWANDEAWWNVYRLPRPGTHRVIWQLSRQRFFGLVGVTYHTTPYTDSKSCFPLCEGCWSSLVPNERLPYYKRLWDHWVGDASLGGYAAPEPQLWEQIAAAVTAGK